MIVELAMKTSLVLLAGLVSLSLCRRQSAAARHWICAVTVAATLAAPLASSLSGWLGASTFTTHLPAPLQRLPKAAWEPAMDTVNVWIGSGTPGASRLDAWLPLTWAAGFSLMLSAAAYGFWQLRRLTAQSRVVASDDRRAQMANDVRQKLGIRRSVRLLESKISPVPITFANTVVLPAASRKWKASWCHAVFCHELAHLRRYDYWINLMTEAMCLLCWFNPLAWVVGRNLRLSAESACDDVVLSHGTAADAYAAGLLSLSRESNGLPGFLRATSTLYGSCPQIASRIRSIVDEQRPRADLRTLSRVAVAVVAILLVAVVGSIPVVIPAQAGSNPITIETMPGGHFEDRWMEQGSAFTARVRGRVTLAEDLEGVRLAPGSSLELKEEFGPVEAWALRLTLGPDGLPQLVYMAAGRTIPPSPSDRRRAEYVLRSFVESARLDRERKMIASGKKRLLTELGIGVENPETDARITQSSLGKEFQDVWTKRAALVPPTGESRQQVLEYERQRVELADAELALLRRLRAACSGCKN